MYYPGLLEEQCRAPVHLKRIVRGFVAKAAEALIRQDFDGEGPHR